MDSDYRPDRHPTFSYKRAKNLKLLLCAALFGLALTPSLGQRLVSTISLPDSLSGTYPVFSAAFSPVNNRVYVGGLGHAVIGIDAGSLQKMSRVDVPGYVDALTLNATCTKLYAIDDDRRSVYVIDLAVDSVSRVIDVEGQPSAYCYSARQEKLYCTDSFGSTVSVIDCVADTILASIAVGEAPTALCLDSSESKLYCASQRAGTLTVIDVDGDTVLRKIPGFRHATALCCNTARNKVYCINNNMRNVSVIDASSDSIVAEVFISGRSDRIMYGPANDKVYCYGAQSGSVVVIGCDGDSVLADLDLLYSRALCYDSVSRRIYCGRPHEVDVVDGATDSLVAEIPIDNEYCFWAGQTSPDRVWLAGERVIVLDADADTVESMIPVGCKPRSLCFSSVSRKLYVGYMLGTQGEVAAIDPATDAILARIRVPDLSDQLCYSPAADKIYTGRATVGVVSCVADSLIKTIPVGEDAPSRLCANPDAGEVYYASLYNQSLAVIDAYADTIRNWVHLGSGAYELCYNPLNHCVYVQLVDSSAVAVVKGDAVAACVYTGLQEGGGLVLNPLTNCLYDSEYPYGQGRRVAMIDCGDNLLLRHFQLPAQPSRMCVNTRDNRVYVSTLLSDKVFVIDGANNGIDSLRLGEMFMGDVFYNPLSNHVYCSVYQVYVVDGATNLVTDSFPAEADSRADRPSFALDPDLNRVYTLADGKSGVLVIQDTASVGVTEMPVATPTGAAAPTIVHGEFFLPEASSRRPQAASLMDAAGRKVMDLQPGVNDVRSLAPGVYFVREAQAQARAQAVRKVVVTR